MYLAHHEHLACRVPELLGVFVRNIISGFVTSFCCDTLVRRQSSILIMPPLLAGKSAAITGGVTGIGRAIALEFLRNGAAVAVNHLGDARSKQDFDSLLKEAPEGAKLVDAIGDIGKKETGIRLVEAAVQNGGGLDIFVANAGVSEFHDFVE